MCFQIREGWSALTSTRLKRLEIKPLHQCARLQEREFVFFMEREGAARLRPYAGCYFNCTSQTLERRAVPSGPVMSRMTT